MAIAKLKETTINRIAAGEVVERPASVVKELVENAIDAGATRIAVQTAGGGKSLIQISDNGCGMSADDLALSVERHCTSKLKDDAIFDIPLLGFRGEALPSIGAVSHLKITSRQNGAESAHQIDVNGGKTSPVTPAALSSGTIVDVRDLFFSVPARLKFLGTDRAETTAITDIVKRIALAHPEIRFTLSGTDRSTTEYRAEDGDEAHFNRMTRILGDEFAENALEISAEKENVKLTGFVSLPSYHRATGQFQYLYVNGRPVRDKMMLGAIRGAYSDFLVKGRFPVLVLNIEIDRSQVDVNVHPAKADVRFQNSHVIRSLLVGGIRDALFRDGHRASTALGAATLDAIRRPITGSPSTYSHGPVTPPRHYSAFSAQAASASPAHAFAPLDPNLPGAYPDISSDRESFRAPTAPSGFEEGPLPGADTRPVEDPELILDKNYLGAARTQLHENYIVAQTPNGMVIVDQHAAHERLVYEKLKAGLQKNGISTQILLIPEIVELPEEDAMRLEGQAELLARTGLVIERFGKDAVAVRETPSILGEFDIRQLVKDLADEIAEWGTAQEVETRLYAAASRIACHGSVRSGRRLLPDEMNALLREMEETPHSGTCNHGRPTFVELKLSDIERLFGRT